MDGLYVYSTIAAAALLTLSIWTWAATTFRHPDKLKLPFFPVDSCLGRNNDRPVLLVQVPSAFSSAQWKVRSASHSVQ